MLHPSVTPPSQGEAFPSDTLRHSSAKVGITTANNGSRAPHLKKCPLFNWTSILCLQRHTVMAYGSVDQQLQTYLTQQWS